ncbi:hypothetical protein O181_017826 [Austropuccinia psidii MF-1]|uniref:CCHC-type domain-containing protein n=1 Tax=Austropuccinia psidii MF-1 TaxID=1389203 RepID=A0A9Q3C437_9BASI|nr:hypothetical protein [Austropuccinia psidii MF-1]
MYYNGNTDYFDQDADDENHLRNLVAILFNENSTDHSVFDSITSPMQKLNARHIYQAMKKRFNKPSWSSIVHHARTIFNTTDQLNNINKYAISFHDAIAKIEHQIGKLDSENIATFAIYFSINTASPSFNHSTNLARINTSFPGKKPEKDGEKPRITLTSHDDAGKKKKTFNPSRPCYYCRELGHWTSTCPIKIKANNKRNQFKECAANVAGFDATPSIETIEALLDSGATHSVVGNISLFTYLLTTNMTLSVASNDKFTIVGIGRINLNIGNSFLEVDDVLYCKDIPGIILSIGKLIAQSIDVRFNNDKFILHQSGKFFHSFKKNS